MDFTLAEIMNIVRRRALMIVMIVVVGSVITTSVAYLLPATYISTAKILIESQAIPSKLARSTITSGTNERIEVIRQRLMTRGNLVELIDELDLYSERNELSLNEKVRRIRASTSMDKIAIGSRRRRSKITAFTLSFSDSNPGRAARVANELVTMTLELNIKARSERAAETHEFFKQEVQRFHDELIEVETQITAFRNENAGALPGSGANRTASLNSVNNSLLKNAIRKLRLEQRKTLLKEKLDAGVIGASANTMSSRQRHLSQLKQKLAEARTVFAESHPTIRGLRSKIAVLESSPQPAAAESETDAADVRQDLAIMETRQELEAIEAELKVLEAETESLEKRKAHLEEAIERAPGVALQWTALQRKQSQLQDRYDDAVRKLAKAEQGEKLEVNQQAERFEVIEQAQVPGAPASPNRILIAGGGVAGSLGFALALTLLLELLNKGLRGAADLERRLDLRPIVAVPYIKTEHERRSIRRRRRLVALLLFVIAPLSLYAIDQFYLPLDLLAERIVEKTKIDELIRVIELRLSG